jgi:hypothetical protein
MLNVLLTQSLSDCADPALLLRFLTCTVNLTNEFLHLCILVALFGGDGMDSINKDNDNNVCMMSWNPRRELTLLPQFYVNGTARLLAMELIMVIAGGKMYGIIKAVKRLLSPRGYDPITALHGGKLIRRRVMNWLGNNPLLCGVAVAVLDEEGVRAAPPRGRRQR